MSQPKVLVVTGFGINCEEETAHAFELAGASCDIVHINDLITRAKSFNNYQILAFPGGFSYGDDTGSGKAFANRVKNQLWPELLDFVQQDKLVIGICNGFQIVANLGLVPSLDSNYGERSVALINNDFARYKDRWVDLVAAGDSPWLKNITTISMPIAHGEGKFYATSEILTLLRQQDLVALRYFQGPTSSYQSLTANPNGSLDDIAGITDKSGRILGLMPHPERAINFTQLPHWTMLKEKYLRQGKPLPQMGPGIQIFQNAVNYFQ
jgi:phosphoribosylformylglycinamidine synthase subunit PurQ / glutaminase